MLASLRRWSVVVFVLLAVVYLNQDIALRPDELTAVRSQVEQQFDIARIYVRHHISGKLMVTVVGSPKLGGEIQKITLSYDRQRQSMTTLGTKSYFEAPWSWFLRALAIVFMLSGWLLVLDPWLAGRCCPACRRWGWLPQPLKEREKTVFLAKLSDEGGYWPEIIETERYCPTCSFQEFSVRQYTPVMQGDVALELRYGLPRLSEQREKDALRTIQEKIKKEAISREEYTTHLIAARKTATQKSTPRE